ncbi:MAG: cyclic nucleotide-binding domain-containing protein [Nitrososphaerales archaeon]
MTEWECHHCGHIFEGERTPDECPNCHDVLTFWLEASKPSAAKEVEELLHKIPIFFGLDERSVGDMAKAFREARFAGGTVMVREGEQSVSFSILTEGEAEVKTGGSVVATLRPYQFFGELAALGIQRKRTADVVASGQCKCLVAVQPELQRILSSHPSVASHILSEIRSRYQHEDEPRA